MLIFLWLYSDLLTKFYFEPVEKSYTPFARTGFVLFLLSEYLPRYLDSHCYYPKTGILSGLGVNLCFRKIAVSLCHTKDSWICESPGLSLMGFSLQIFYFLPRPSGLIPACVPHGMDRSIRGEKETTEGLSGSRFWTGTSSLLPYTFAKASHVAEPRLRVGEICVEPLGEKLQSYMAETVEAGRIVERYNALFQYNKNCDFNVYNELLYSQITILTVECWFIYQFISFDKCLRAQCKCIRFFFGLTT